MNYYDLMNYNTPFNEQNLKKLIEKIKAGCVVPYIGAGMSMLFEDIYPSWNGFLELTFSKYLSDDKKEIFNAFDYEQKAGYLYDQIGKITFAEHLKETFSEKYIARDSMKFVSKPIYLIPVIFNKGLIITTNYDKVIEKVYSLHEKIYSFAHPGHFESLNRSLRDQSLLIFKIHGDISEPQTSIILNKEDYDRAYDNEAFNQTLKQAFISKEMLFLGCSLNKDKPIELLCNISTEGMRNFAIVPCNLENVKSRRLQLENEFYTQAILYPEGKHEESLNIILSHIAKEVNPDALDKAITKYIGSETYTNSIKYDCHSIISQKKQTYATIITNSMPFPATEHFIGRDEVMTTVEKMIKERKTVVLYAPPGMGKTEFCRKLFEKYTKEESPFKTIGWLLFRENIVTTFYNQFNFIEELNVEAYWKKIKIYISEHVNDLLLIVDNANTLTPKDLSDLISLGCSIILTTRGKIERLTSKQIDKLSFEECRSLYRMYSKDQVSSDNTINQIIQLSDRHTLSIELLSKTQYASGKSSEELLASIINNGFNLADIDEEISYTHNPEATLEQKSEYVFIEHMAKIFQIADICVPDELRILQLFSLLSPEPFPIGLVKECFDIKSLNTINKLVNKGWISRNDNQNSYNMHPVVSSVILHCAYPNYNTVESMISWVSQKLYIQPNEMSIQKLWIFPHALSIASKLNTEDKEIYASLQNNIAKMYHEQGDYTVALEWYIKALTIREKILGKTHPLVAATYSNIALVKIDQGDYTAAMEWIQKAFVINEELLGQDHASTATTYNNIALVYDYQGNYSKALEWYQKALVIDEILFGQNHSSTATVYNNIATVHDNLGHYPEAIKYFEKALSIRQNVLGQEHTSTATTYNNLASVYERKGDYPKAMEFYQKALDINKKLLDKEHPMLATIYNNIALLYDSQGNYPKAMEWNQKALNIREKVLGNNHLSTATTYSNIGLVYDNQEDYNNAIKWYEKALDFCDMESNNDHPFTGATYNNLGAAYYGKRDYSEAMKWYLKALSIREKVLGKEHPETATTYNNIGVVYYEKRKYTQALEWYHVALPIREKVLGKVHPETAASYICIATVCYANREYHKAKEWYQKALVVYEKVYGKEHPSTKRIFNSMDSIHQRL